MIIHVKDSLISRFMNFYNNLENSEVDDTPMYHEERAFGRELTNILPNIERAFDGVKL